MTLTKVDTFQASNGDSIHPKIFFAHLTRLATKIVEGLI